MTRALFRLLVAGLSLLAAGLGLETAVRLTGRFPTAGICPDPLTGWRYCPGYRRRTQDPQGTPFVLSINRAGFRDDEHAPAKPAGISRILILGDSYAAGTALPREKTAAGLLETALNAGTAPGESRFEVINAAVAAWATDQQLLYLKNEGLRLQPDFVILLSAPNDVREAYAKGFFKVEDGTLRVSPHPPLPLKTRLLWHLAAGSGLFQLLQDKLFHTSHGAFPRVFQDYPPTFRIGDRLCADQDLFLKNEPPELSRALELFDAFLLETARVSREAGAKFILSVVPTQLELDGRLPGIPFEPGRVSERVRRLARKDGLPFVDLFAAFKREKDFRDAFLIGDYHLSEAGHTLVTNEIRQTILPLLHKENHRLLMSSD
ncbi:MAG: hypothetical protein A2X36_11565 [Elusimicrobia bacterium GWA2_69_24]|nr:MAG: hypothetical protein A2X36_11565 [Elusimicrobia bacterium GWA2_69_24]